MKIAIATPQPERKIEIGDVIVAKNVLTGKALYYQLVRIGQSGAYKLLNLKHGLIMESFESHCPQSAFDYVEVAVKAKIMEVVPSSKLKLSLKEEDNQDTKNIFFASTREADHFNQMINTLNNY